MRLALLIFVCGLVSAQSPQGPDRGPLTLPSSALDPGIEAVKDIEYTSGEPEDADKHKLNIYRQTGAKNAPVLFFVHGGAWTFGDRRQYPPLGNRFAKAGCIVVTPSYRLAPKHPHPAQIEDVAAAFAWTVRNIAQQGGDPARIFIAGHSAGGHLVALLATNSAWLARYNLSTKNIRGVIALSGVYDVSGPLMAGGGVFPEDLTIRQAASLVKNVKPGLPPFLVTYCQFDYPSLPQMAERFHETLQSAGVHSELLYVRGFTHITEIIDIVRPEDPTAQAMLKFLETYR